MSADLVSVIVPSAVSVAVALIPVAGKIIIAWIKRRDDDKDNDERNDE